MLMNSKEKDLKDFELYTLSGKKIYKEQIPKI